MYNMQKCNDPKNSKFCQSLNFNPTILELNFPLAVRRVWQEIFKLSQSLVSERWKKIHRLYVNNEF